MENISDSSPVTPPQEAVETEEEKWRREYREYIAPLVNVGERYGLVTEIEYKLGDKTKRVDLSLENQNLYADLKLRTTLDEATRNSLEKNLVDVKEFWEKKKREIIVLETELEQLNQEAVILGKKLEERWRNPLFRMYDPEWIQLEARHQEISSKLRAAQIGEGFSERHWRERIAVLEAILGK